MITNWRSGLTLALLTSVALAGCTAPSDNTATPKGEETRQPDAVQELNLNIGDDIPTLDLSKANDILSYSFFNATMEGLVRIGKDGKVEPGMAQKWDVSPDGLTYTFHLRDAKWQNGEPVTAQDFEFSWKRTLDPATKSGNADILAWLKNGMAYAKGQGKADDVGVKALDNKTLQVVLELPRPYFVEQTASPFFFPQNKKFVEAAGAAYGSEPDKFIGNGPFQLTEWNHDASVKIEKSASYWDAKTVKLQKVNFVMLKDTNSAMNLYESGQVDMVALVREQIETYKDSPELRSEIKPVSTFLPFNQRTKALTSKKVRQALTYGVDAQALVDVVLGNGSVPANSLTPKGTRDGAGGDFSDKAGDLIHRKVNAGKAKQLFEEGLKEVGVTGPLKLRYLTDDGTTGKKMAEFLKSQWEKNLGVEIEIEAVPFKNRIQKLLTGDYDIGTVAWNPNYNDPTAFLGLWTSTGTYNGVIQWKNAEYDQAVNAADRESDPQKRVQHLLQAEKIIMDELPVSPLYWLGTKRLQKAYVKDLVLPPIGIDFELKWTYIQGKK